MHNPQGKARAHPRLAAVLLVALLPTLTYFGHWPAVAIPLPGTAAVLALPFASGETAAGDHHQHCHADAAECSSGPGSFALAVSLLAAAIALALPGGPLLPVRAPTTRLALQHLPAPEPGPPRRTALAPATG
ncbi:hypothetical protein [Tepidiforma thermophila]|uniref:Uncharacterized protein n=1 Tax=Tepidiforma thermophila (strain KCTC 52669 / CGMCC 1.13589 / G233) TaxID=2761530 RepID=A0A2A9HDV3_TEPT2|nr:hypothetical protein [Tepidiforma thermophila]PFG73166.1 hypothetical protein A9A59_0361 [Tepidiforma thermophila]